MKATGSVILAAASASTSVLAVAVPASSVSYLVAAYEELTSTCSSPAPPTSASDAEGSSNLGDLLSQQSTETDTTITPSSTTITLATLPTATGLTPAGALAAPTTSNTDASLTQQALSSLPSASGSGINATLAAVSAESEAQGTQQISPSVITTSTSLISELNASSHSSTQTLSTGQQYGASPDSEALPAASMPLYVTTVTYFAGASTLPPTCTSDCNASAIVQPASNPPPSQALLPTPAPPAVWSNAPLPSQTPLTTLELVLGSVTSYITVMIGCSSTAPAPTDLHVPPPPMTSIDTNALPSSMPGSTASSLANPASSQPPPETPSSQAAAGATPPPPPPSPPLDGGDQHTPVPSPSNPALTPPQSPPPSPITNTTLPTVLDVNNTTLATLTSTTTKGISAAATTTHNGGFSQGSGTANPAHFAGDAMSIRQPGRSWMLGVGLLIAAGSIL